VRRQRQMGIRDRFIYQPLTFLKTNIDLMTGKFLTNDVYITSSSLIDAPKLPDLDSLKKTSNLINEFIKQVKKPAYSLIIPTNAQINASKLPAYALLDDETELINNFNNSLDNRTVILDANTPLTSVKNITAYYNTDNRLTSFGAFLIYNYNMKQLGASPASMQKFNIEHVADNFYGALFDRTFYTGVSPDKIDFFHYNVYDITANVVQTDSCNISVFRNTLYDYSQLDNIDKANALFGVNSPIKKMQTNANREHNILIFADHHIDAFMQFFAIHYNNITVVDLLQLDSCNFNAEELTKSIDAESYDKILFAYGIETLANNEQFENLKCFMND
ncbi:MAG: hypothetical protein K2G97_00710, partial [Oscillospiraceae bacterium]|nr:hypothetical protein [Oscillospiraceae bacterium]